MPMNEAAQERLHEIVKKNGRDIIRRPDQCEGLLRDYCPEYRLEVSALVSALKEQVPAELLKPSSGVPRDVQLGLLQRRLQDHVGLTEDVARWAVDSWAIALEQTPSSRKSSDLVVVPSDLTDDRKSAVVPIDNSSVVKPVPPKPNSKAIGAAVAVLLLAGIVYGGVKVWQKLHPVATTQTQQNQNNQNNPNNNQNNQSSQNNNNQNNQNSQPATAGSTVPVGTTLHVHLADSVSSETATVGDEHKGTITSDVVLPGGTTPVIPKGAAALLRVTAVDKAGHVDGAAELSLRVVQVSFGGKTYAVSTASYSEKGKGRGKTTAKRAGIAGAAGAAIGALLGHKHKGTDAAAGAAIGAGGAVAVDAATSGDPVVLTTASALPFHLTKALTL